MFSELPDINNDRTEEGNGYYFAKRALDNGSTKSDIVELIQHESERYKKGAEKALDEV